MSVSHQYSSNNPVMMLYHFCIKAGTAAAPKQRLTRRKITPTSCIDSFFPTGDREKDILTLKNTLFNA